MNKEDYIKQFTQVLVVRQLCFSTIENYLYHLNSFLDWCKNRLPENISHSELIEFLASNPQYSTVKQRRGMLTNLYEYVLAQGFKLFGLPFPKVPEKLPDYFTLHELQRIFNSVTNIKQQTILKLQYACALRVHEVVKVKRTDFVKVFNPHLKSWAYDLRITGKGNKDGYVPVPDETINEIFEYWKSLEKKPREYLFEGQLKSCYSERSVQIIVKQAMIGCGINKQGSTHLLRSSRATHLAHAGVDIKHIKELLRHKLIKTTERYMALNTNSIRVIFNKADQEIFNLIGAEKKLLKEA